MRKKYLAAIVLVLMLLLSFTAGRFYDSRRISNDSTEVRRILYYIDPMDPAHISDKPGKAPCGMDMEPVYEDAASSNKQASQSPIGTVKISAEKQQMIGVKVETVEPIPAKHVIRAAGKVTPDEKRVYRVIAGSDGWIRETYSSDTGTLVKKDQRLASFYSPQFWSAQVSYLSLYGSKDEHYIQPVGQRALAPSQQASISHQTYLDALEGLGMSQQQIKELAETKKLTDKVYIVSPANGFILSRDVSPGQRFEKGAEWYRIADLSRVWVIADLFQNDAEYIKPGMKAKVSTQGGREYQTNVSKVLPQLDAVSRTLKVRLEIDNPGFVLKPDMLVDVEFLADLPQGISIPAEAVLDSGLRKIVFVDRGEGYFEPRQIETGWRTADRVQITKGLMAGEQIVVSGNFLIDSESKMKMAAAGTLKKNTVQRTIDPVCGMSVMPDESRRAGLFLEGDGQAQYFCTKECKDKFAKDPRRYGVVTENKAAQTVPLPNTPKLEKTIATGVKPGSSPEHQKQRTSGQLARSLPMNSGVAHP